MKFGLKQTRSALANLKSGSETAIKMRVWSLLWMLTVMLSMPGNAQIGSRRHGAKPMLTVNNANHPVISANGKRIVVGPEVGITEVYDVSTGRKLQTFRIPESYGHAISADGNRVVIFAEKITEPGGGSETSVTELWLFDASSGKELAHKESNVKRAGFVLRSLAVYGGGGQSMRNISSDLRLIADVSTHGSDLPLDKSGVTLGDTETNSVLRQFGEYGDLYDQWNQVEMTPDARFLAATRVNINQPNRNQTVVWDIETGSELLRLPFSSWWLALSDDGHCLVTAKANSHVTEAWNIADGKRLSEIGAKYGSKVPRMMRGAVSPDGKLLATTGTNRVLIWDTASGRLVAAQQHVSDADGDFVHSVAFSGDGRYLVMGSRDEMVKVWLLAELLKEAAV